MQQEEICTIVVDLRPVEIVGIKGEEDLKRGQEDTRKVCDDW